MRRKNYDKEKGRAKWGGGPFVGLSRDFTESLVLATLSPYGSKLLLDLLAQYNGLNNGDLSTTWSIMAKRGWSGRSTLGKAQKELLDTGLLLLTRQGGKHRPNLYALSFMCIDECKGKLEELSPTKVPLDTWRNRERALKMEERSSIANRAKVAPRPPGHRT